jgi:hypothetical protein
MPKAKVVELKDPRNDMLIATCMNCHGTSWYIHIDAPGKDFKNITKLQCANPDCGMFINANIPVTFE